MSHGGLLRIKPSNILSCYAEFRQRRGKKAISVVLGDIWEEAKKRKLQTAQMRLTEDTENAENKVRKGKIIIHRWFRRDRT